MFFKKDDKNNETLVKASLYGFFIGDALGVPVEFMDRNSLKQNRVVDMKEYGTHHQPKGTWSDDSSMVLATIDGLLNSKLPNIDYSRIMYNFLEWKTRGEFTPNNNVFDIGLTTSSAIYKYQQNIKNGTPQDVVCGSGDIKSNGNGSLMRILPISLYFYFLGMDYSDSKMFDTIRIISSMTHAHIYSILGCYIYTIYVIELLKEHNKYKAYYNLQKIIQNACTNNSNFKDIKEIYGRLIYDDISKLKEEDIKSSGYVVDSLEAAIWSVLTTKKFDEAVLKAVNLGNDTDTIGAITGGLAGIIYGYNAIPNKWINDLQRKDYLEQIFNSFIKSLESLDVNNEKGNSKMKINIDKKILQDTINDLKNNPDACKIGGGNEVNGIIHMLYSDPGEQLSKFMKYFYEIQLGDTNYIENMKLTQNKDISILSFDEVRTELTAIIRAERFCSGAWHSAVESGRLLELLERLNDLVDNE